MASGRAEEARGLAKYPIPVTICIGVLLICTPLLFNDLVLAQPQCDGTLHPVVHTIIAKLFVLMDKIGEAAIIAGLIGIAVDQGLKTKLIQEVVRAASPKLIGRHLPESVRDALLSYFKIIFIRPEWQIVYEITEVS